MLLLNLTEIPVPFWSNRAHCGNLWQTIPIETNIRGGLISHNLTLASAHSLPLLLISICSLLSLSVLSSCLLSCSPSLQSSSVLATPSIIPTQGELEAVQTWSLEPWLGDFQPRSPGFTPGLRAWELAAQGGYCRREINHTWQPLCETKTYAHAFILGHTEPRIPTTWLLLFPINEDVK